ncbi:MAG: flagellar export chaperone FlgN [Armatimonadetes bacterium]|nr:flagellar export chaperone FlgN [Armatimonadota bacterium]
MITNELQKIWWDWLSTSERMLRSLHEQTAAIMLRDVERVEKMQPELTRLIQALRETDDRAVACARGLAEKLGVEPNFRSLVSTLEKEEQRQVQALANRVKAAAQTVQRVMRKNQTLIENELAYVAGSLHMLAKTSEDREGDFGQRTHAAVLLDEKA